MRHAITLCSSRLELRNLESSDATARYVGWLNDPIINRYLEVRFQTHSVESTAEFIRAVNASPDTVLFGMFVDGGRRHIGNIKLGPVSVNHRRADIGLMIGDRCEWGKGLATEAIALVADYGFHDLHLAKITAGCYGANKGSIKAFEKAGFVVEARLLRHWLTPDGSDDEFLIGQTAEQHAELTRPRLLRKFGQVKQLTFIGGGDLMIETALAAREVGFTVKVLMAPRHAEEILPLAGLVARDACRISGLDHLIVENINVEGAVFSQPWSGPRALAICFGPTWVFADKVIAAFGAGMINFNGIPIPHYLGGAHYTWQILNCNRRGGCFLQEINSRVDRGDVLRAERFDLKDEIVTPRDYFAANHAIGLRFLRRVLADFRADVPFTPESFRSISTDSIYFPRLMTTQNGWLDWTWTGQQIEAFCRAFDDPYLGAGTYYRNKEVRLKRAVFELGEPAGSFHPYVSGLIVRKRGSQIWIAVQGGLLRVDYASDTCGTNLIPTMREGDRFATPSETLYHSRTYSAGVKVS